MRVHWICHSLYDISICHSLNCESALDHSDGARTAKRAMKRAVIQKKSSKGLSERAVRGRSRAGGGGSGGCLETKGSGGSVKRAWSMASLMGVTERP